MLLVSQLRFRVLAVFAALALVMPMVMMPAGAVQAQEKEQCQWEGIMYLDTEIKIIGGQPVIVVETKEGYVSVPFELPGHLHGADGQRVVLEMQGNSVILPTGDGLVAVPIEEFCVVMVDGQVALLAEENPTVLIAIGWGIFTVTQYAKFTLVNLLREEAMRVNR